MRLDRFDPACTSGRGFALVELAVAIFIICMVLGSLLVPVTRQVEQRQTRDTQKSMDEIREALIGFALANGYLPCPAVSSTNGVEDRTGSVCTGGKRNGFLPWQTLGVAKLDAWGNIFRYSVTSVFATSGTSTFTLSSNPDITIQTRLSGTLGNLTNAQTVVAVVLSPGKNGYGGYNDSGNPRALPTTGWPASYPDENTNSSGTTTFVYRTLQEPDATAVGGEFDDIVVWLPAYSLFNRMVTATKLP